MKKKKIISMLLSVTLLFSVGMGATLAYFSDSEEISNVVTMGKVDIALTENEVRYDETQNKYVIDESKPVTTEGLEFSDVLPGETVPKNPTITIQKGSADCYIRAKVTVQTDKESTITEEEIREMEDSIRTMVEKEDLSGRESMWYFNETDGYYYYNEKLIAGTSETEEAFGEDKAVLFHTVTIPTSWANSSANQTFSIMIQAQAIQADYLEEGVLLLEEDTKQIIGWDIDVSE